MTHNGMCRVYVSLFSQIYHQLAILLRIPHTHTHTHTQIHINTCTHIITGVSQSQPNTDIHGEKPLNTLMLVRGSLMVLLVGSLISQTYQNLYHSSYYDNAQVVL